MCLLRRMGVAFALGTVAILHSSLWERNQQKGRSDFGLLTPSAMVTDVRLEQSLQYPDSYGVQDTYAEVP